MIKIAENTQIKRKADEIKHKADEAYKQAARLERYFAKWRWQKGLQK